MDKSRFESFNEEELNAIEHALEDALCLAILNNQIDAKELKLYQDLLIEIFEQ